MSAALLTPPNRQVINWRVHARIEKFSPHQTAFALRQLEGRFGPRMIARGTNPLFRGSLAEVLHACGAPEDGVREESGNLLVTQGLDQITKLLQGVSATALSNTHGICGVGNGTTAATTSDTALTADNSANAFYQSFDASYPTQSNGVMTGQSTFASGNANFAWNEWCWATSTGTVGASTSTILHTTSGSGGWTTSTTQYLWNHKVPASSLGTKASGASWVFTTTITLS